MNDQTPFVLDERLASDTVSIGTLDLCELLLMNDSQYPWLILVPRVSEVTEIIDLDESQQAQLTQESALVAQILKKYFGPGKMNIAALGNVVSQLHIHHVMRYPDDISWPGPIWGAHPAKPYADDALSDMTALLKEAFFGA